MYLWTVTWENGYTTTLPLEVFTQRNFLVDFIRLKLNFIYYKQKTLFDPPFGDLIRGIVCIPSVAHWKAHIRLSIRHNWTIFAIFYGCDVISGNLSKSAFSKGWVTLSAHFRRKRELPFRVVSKYPQCIVWFCHKARMWQTDRQPDGQRDDFQDRASIAASRGKNDDGEYVSK